MFGTLPGNISPVYPSSGIALAAMILLGYRALPGIAIGALISNDWFFTFPAEIHLSPAALFIAGMIVLGSTLQPLLGRNLLNRLDNPRCSLRSLPHLLKFITIIPITCLVSATAGVGGAVMMGQLSGNQFLYSWITWWLGDAFGILITTPLILAFWEATGDTVERSGKREAIIAFALLIAVDLFIFFDISSMAVTNRYFEYLSFLILIWMALRFDIRCIISAIAVNAGIAIAGTSTGSGPFVYASFNTSLLTLDCFLAVMTLTTLLIYAIVSERRHARTMLQFTQFAIDHLGDAAYWMNASGKLTYVNQAAIQMLGYSKHELLSMTVHDLGNDFPPEKWLNHWENLKRVKYRTFSAIQISKEGRRVPVEITSNFVELDGIEYNCAFAKNITSRIKADEKRQSLEMQFVQAQKMESVGRLAGGIAHDFKTLLSIINGSAELLLKAHNTSPKANHIIDDIKQASLRGAALINQLLAFGRKQTILPQRIDVNQHILETTKLIRRLVLDNISLDIQLDAKNSQIMFDPGQLDQVLINLATNAVDAMQQGGKLSINAQNKTMPDTIDQPYLNLEAGNYVQITVADTGCGMEKEIMANIFEPFFTTKGPEYGTGLGLSTVYGIVKQNKGDIYVESEPDEGAIFRLLLPTLLPINVSKETITEKNDAHNGVTSVLIVEKDQRVSSVIKDYLEILDYKVWAATDAPSAKDIVMRMDSPLHLMITALDTTGIAGQELSREMLRIHPEMKIIYTAGYVEEKIWLEIQTATNSTLLKKPIIMEKLANAIRDLLENNPG